MSNARPDGCSPGSDTAEDIYRLKRIGYEVTNVAIKQQLWEMMDRLRG